MQNLPESRGNQHWKVATRECAMMAWAH